MHLLLRYTKNSFHFIFKYYTLAIIALTLGLIASCLELLLASLMMPLLQFLGNTSNQLNTLSNIIFIDRINNLLIRLPENWRFLGVLIFFLLVASIKNINRYFSAISINQLQLKTGIDIREKCTKRLLKLEVDFYNNAKIGELLSYISEHTQRIELLISYILEIINNIVTIGVLLFLLLDISPSLTLIAVLGLSIIGIFLRPIVKSVQFYGNKTAKHIDSFSNLITEIITGIRVVKSFNAEKIEFEKIQQALQLRYRAEFNGFKCHSAVAPVTETAGIIILVLLLGVGSNLLSGSADIKLTLLITYIFALLRILPRVNHLNSLRSQISLLSGSLDAVDHFLASTDNLSLPDGHITFNTLKSELAIKNLTFSFAERLEPTIKNLDLTISKGTTVALVGASGSGKSTLTDLILRFYDPDSGSIAIDGIDLKKYQLDSWRRSLAVVSQDTFLFHASVKDNIAYGCDNVTETEILEAAKKAYADEFIQEFPQGFDTIVGNRGTKLSGGQRQRIAIARAILRNPEILILDEATSALDTNSERIVQKAIEKVSQNRTVIVIAHRLSTIKKADLIVVLREGKAIEQGTHQQLLANKGEYWSLYSFQLSSQTAL